MLCGVCGVCGMPKKRHHTPVCVWLAGVFLAYWLRWVPSQRGRGGSKTPLAAATAGNGAAWCIPVTGVEGQHHVVRPTALAHLIMRGMQQQQNRAVCAQAPRGTGSAWR